MAPQPGDWPCPDPSCRNHSNLVFGKYDACPKCGTAKPIHMNGGGGHGGAQGGDWPCPDPSCLNHTKLVFGSRDSCPKCGSARMDEPMVKIERPMRRAPPMQRAPPMHTSAPADGVRPDDWQCPNGECINHTKLVFGKHEVCPSCGTARNAVAAGDWQCPNFGCQNHRSLVFASKPSCPKCGAVRPVRGSRRVANGQGVMAMPTRHTPGGYMMQQPAMQYAPIYPTFGFAPQMHQGKGGGKGAAPGDWMCPNTDCINNRKLVFGKHVSCPKCGCENPKKPDWQCPNGDCINHTKLVFGTKASCPKCGAENPRGGGRARSRSPRR